MIAQWQGASARINFLYWPITHEMIFSGYPWRSKLKSVTHEACRDKIWWDRKQQLSHLTNKSLVSNICLIETYNGFPCWVHRVFSVVISDTVRTSKETLKKFHLTFYDGCNYLSMFIYRLTRVIKGVSCVFARVRYQEHTMGEIR